MIAVLALVSKWPDAGEPSVANSGKAGWTCESGAPAAWYRWLLL